MEYKIEWIGEAFLGLSTDTGRHIGMSLMEDHPVPEEFKVDDRVRITEAETVPYEPYKPDAQTEGRAYFTITHIGSGKTLSVWHETNGWSLEPREEK